MARRTDKNTEKTATGRNRNGTFAQGNAGGPGRPVGSVNALLRQARDAAEQIALPQIIDHARAGDLYACRVLLQLGLPKMRPVSIPEPFSLQGDTMSEKAQAIIDLVANGELSTQTASEVASIISTACKVDELTELRLRIEAIDQKLQDMGEGK